MLKLKVLKGAPPGQTFTLRMGENIVGRTDGCDVIFAVHGVSKQHAKIVVQGEQAILTDLDSSNGTFVNGAKVSHRILRRGDRIGFATVIVELVTEEKVHLRPHMDSMPTAPATQWQANTAYAAQPTYGAAPVAASHQPVSQAEKKDFVALVRGYVENVAMPGVYKIAEHYPMRQVLGAFVLLYILIVTGLSTIPMVQLTQESIFKESERRAVTLARQLATMSEAQLRAGSIEASLRTDFIEREEGVSMALVIGPDGHIIAPIGRGESWASNEFSVRARKKNNEYSAQINSHTIGASVPIKSFNTELGQQTTVAYAQVVYDSGELAVDSGKAAGLFARILIIAILAGSVLYFLLYKIIVHPLSSLTRQLDSALRGEGDHLKSPFLFPELEPLINNMNAALGRVGQASQEAASVKPDRTQEAVSLVSLSSDAAFALDREKRFTQVNPRFEDLTGMRQATLQLQSTEILNDTSLHLSLQDLLARAEQTPGLIVSNQLEISGTSYSIEVLATGEFFFGVLRGGS